MEFWPTLAEITMVERDNRFADLAKTLAATSTQPSLKNVQVACADLEDITSRAELVVAAYIFVEQREAAAAELALRLLSVRSPTFT